jgi:hypothetical protein
MTHGHMNVKYLDDDKDIGRDKDIFPLIEHCFMKT